jgi:hypothetical protein
MLAALLVLAEGKNMRSPHEHLLSRKQTIGIEFSEAVKCP